MSLVQTLRAHDTLDNVTIGMEMTTIVPSPEARHVYNMMVMRAEETPTDDLHLTLASTIELSVTLNRLGEDGTASSAVAELRQADWIAPVQGGGWLLGS